MKQKSRGSKVERDRIIEDGKKRMLLRLLNKMKSLNLKYGYVSSLTQKI